MLEAVWFHRLQDAYRLGYASGHEQSSHKVEIVVMGRERIEAHRAFDPRYCRHRITQEGQVDAALHDEARIIRILRQGAFQMVFALCELAIKQGQAAHEAVTFSIALVESRCGLNQPRDFRKLRRRIAISIDSCVAERAGLPGVGRSETRIEFDGPVEASLGFLIRLCVM